MDAYTYEAIRSALEERAGIASNRPNEPYDSLRATLEHDVFSRKQHAALPTHSHHTDSTTSSPPPSSSATAAAKSVESFLCVAALRSMHETGRRESSVEHYLRHLKLPAGWNPSGSGRDVLETSASRCDTFTQDTDITPSSDVSTDGTRSATVGGEGSTTTAAEEDEAPSHQQSTLDVPLPQSGQPHAGNVAGVPPTSERVSAGADGVAAMEGSASALDSDAGSFLFGSAPFVVKAGLSGVSCTQFQPSPNTGSSAGSAFDDPSAADSAPATLACGTSTGELWLLAVSLRGRPVGDAVLLGTHPNAIVDLCFSDDGRCLLCVSRDAFVSVWDVDRREKIREIATHYPGLSGKLLPFNNNYCVIGVRAPYVRVFNLSTGMLVKQVRTPEPVVSIATDNVGNFVFTADEKGGICAFATVMASGQVRRVAMLSLGPERGGPLHLAWQAGGLGLRSFGARSADTMTDLIAANVHAAVLLIAFQQLPRPETAAATLTARLAPGRGICTLNVLRTVPIPQLHAPLRGCFCERTPDAPSAFIATGSEDGCVHIVSANASRSDVVVALSPGYPCVITHVAWDTGQSVLAAGTDTGDVVAWRRLRVRGGDAVDAEFQQTLAAGMAASSHDSDAEDDEGALTDDLSDDSLRYASSRASSGGGSEA